MTQNISLLDQWQVLSQVIKQLTNMLILFFLLLLSLYFYFRQFFSHNCLGSTGSLAKSENPDQTNHRVFHVCIYVAFSVQNKIRIEKNIPVTPSNLKWIRPTDKGSKVH